MKKVSFYLWLILMVFSLVAYKQTGKTNKVVVSVGESTKFSKTEVNAVKDENIIVLLSNFDVDSSGADGGFNPDSMYSNWSWILIRDSKTGNWRVDDWGY